MIYPIKPIKQKFVYLKMTSSYSNSRKFSLSKLGYIFLKCDIGKVDIIAVSSIRIRAYSELLSKSTIVDEFFINTKPEINERKKNTTYAVVNTKTTKSRIRSANC